MYRFLVTGASGFIGSHLVNALLNKGYLVTGLDNFSSSTNENLSFISDHKYKYNFTFIEGDIRDQKLCHRACSNIDYVSHQAALGSVPRSLKEPSLYNDNNITGTLNLLIAARDQQVKRFIYASSSSVYGDTPTLPKKEEMMPNPKSPYALTKYTNECYAKLFNDVYGLPTIGLRYFNVFGPRQNPHSQYAAVIPKFISLLLQKKSPIIFGDGNQTRDFTYIDNVVQANISSFLNASNKAFGRSFNIGNGQTISINLLVKYLNDLLKLNIKPDYKSVRPGDVKDSLADISLSKQILRYENKISVEEGLILTLKYFS